MAKFSFRDKVAVITGGSRGLGFLIAQELSRHGAKLVLLARNETERWQAERRLAIISGALSGLVLESHFRPALLPAKSLRDMTLKLIDSLIEV